MNQQRRQPCSRGCSVLAEAWKEARGRSGSQSAAALQPTVGLVAGWLTTELTVCCLFPGCLTSECPAEGERLAEVEEVEVEVEIWFLRL